MIDRPTTDKETQELLALAGTKVIYDKLGLTGVETSRQGMRGEITNVNMNVKPACFVVKWEDGSIQDYSFASLHSSKRWPYARMKPHIRSYILLQPEFPVEYLMGVGKSRPLDYGTEEKVEEPKQSSRVDQVTSWKVICATTDTVLAEYSSQEKAERGAEINANNYPGDDIQVVAVISTWSTGKAKRYPPDPQSI